MARPSGRDIRQAVVDRATDAIRSHGVTGFSYGDLAREVGVRAPSIHHHFGRKDDLVAETARQYRTAFRSRVDAIQSASALDRLAEYVDLFLAPADDGVLCLCGAAAAGWEDLGPDAQAEIAGFFADEVTWVSAQVAAAQGANDARPEVDPSEFAAALVSALEGVLLLARVGVGREPAVAPRLLLRMLAVD